MTKLNILIGRPTQFLGEDGRLDFGPVVRVRYSFSAVTDSDLPTPDAPIGRQFGKTSERWDPTMINSANNLGAFVNVYPIEEMRAYVAELRSVWGPLHVQDNTGLLPDCDQGPWKDVA